jgi:hypothetical protein
MAVKFLNGIDLGNQRILAVADPSSATDGANKQYVDNFVRGLSWKDAVLCASTANIASLSSPGSSIDGVTLTDQCRVLLKNQTTASQNGIYTYTLSTTTLARSLDMPTGVDARGYAVTVRGGSVADDTVWHVTSDPSIVGTDSITFTQLGSSGSAYVAGAGLTESPANTFNVVGSGGITVNADDIALSASVAGAGLTHTSGVLAVGAGSGITVNADDVALASSAAGAGLTYTSGVLAVVGGLGITVAADLVSIASNVPVQEIFPIGDGSTTAITVTFTNIATKTASIEVWRNATPWEQVFPDISRPTGGTAVITFATAPTTNQYNVVATGR